MAQLVSHTSKTSLDLVYDQISAYEQSSEMLEHFYEDLKSAQKEAKKKSQTVILDYAGAHSLHVYPTGKIQLMYSGPLYELVE